MTFLTADQAIANRRQAYDKPTVRGRRPVDTAIPQRPDVPLELTNPVHPNPYTAMGFEPTIEALEMGTGNPYMDMASNMNLVNPVFTPPAPVTDLFSNPEVSNTNYPTTPNGYRNIGAVSGGISPALANVVGNTKAKAIPSGRTDIDTFITRNKNRKYSQPKRYAKGHGDCSTFACRLQREVYGKKMKSDTTLGMMRDGTKTDTPTPGTVAIYKTGKNSRHAVTYLPNGNVIQLGNAGVKERSPDYYNKRYKLLGNYNF